MGRILSQRRPLSSRHQRALAYALEMIKQSEFADYVTDLYLFGSCAREEARWKSDIDLLLTLSPEAKAITDFNVKLHALKGSISEETPESVETDLKVVFGDEWKNSSALFFENIRKEGISIWH